MSRSSTDAIGRQVSQMPMPGSEGPSYRLTVRDVVSETSQAQSILLDVPSEVVSRFEYVPGQFLTVRIPAHNGRGSIARCYSIASAPDLDDHIMVGVKRVPGGAGSNWMCDHVRPGDELEVLPPAGRFTPPSLDANLLLFAGGSGITPIISIARSVLERGSGAVVLVYANRNEDEVIYADRIRDLRERHPARFTLVYLFESVDGLPTLEGIEALAREHSGRDAAFVCGPEPFMDAVEVGLGRAGMSREQIILERFVSLEGDPFAGSAPVVGVSGDTTDTAALSVVLDGVAYELAWPRATSLLDFLLSEGLAAPYSCREGACSACACRVESGEVSMSRNEVLDADDLRDGLVLACQARPVTDQVVISYD